MNRIDENLEIGIQRLNTLFPENKDVRPQAVKTPIEEMEAAGIDMDDVRDAVGGRLENILHVERKDENTWKLRVQRITPSGNYQETITISAASNVLSENAQKPSSPDEAKYRLTPDEAAQQVSEVLGGHLLKVEAVRGDAKLIALHIRENRDTAAMHRIFADLNSTMNANGWHVTMKENHRWTMSPAAGSFLEKRATLRAADQGAHLYPPSYYAGRSTEALLRSSELRDGVPVKEDTAISEAKKTQKVSYPTTPSEILSGIKNGTLDGVFLRHNDNMSLCFLPGPYGTSGRQYSGRDLTNLVERNDSNAVNLGSPGWYGDMPKDQIAAAKEIISWLGSEDIPGYPGEYVDAQDIIKSRQKESITESDARKRAFKAGYPMTPQHALAQSTDAIMYPAIGDNAKMLDQDEKNKEKKPTKKDNGGSVMNKAVNVSGDFL